MEEMVSLRCVFFLRSRKKQIMNFVRHYMNGCHEEKKPKTKNTHINIACDFVSMSVRERAHK